MPDGTCIVRKGRLTWTGSITPSSISETYRVRIDFVVGKRPEVVVLSPALEHPEGRVLKHTYEGDQLCLYLPGQWDSSMSIAATIIPWTAEWLAHYEIWVVTGNWNGAGHEFPRRTGNRAHPGRDPSNSNHAQAHE